MPEQLTQPVPRAAVPGLWIFRLLLFLAPAFTVFGGGFTIVDLGTLSGNYSLGYGVNSNGFVTGESAVNGNSTHAFLYRITNTVDLNSAQPPTASYGSGHALNNSGLVVGQFVTNGQYRAGMVTATGTKTDLGTLGGDYSDAHGINNAGQIVGEAITSSATGGNDHAYFRDTVSTNLIDIGTLGGSYSSAFGINSSAHIVGEADTPSSGTHAFYFDGTNMTDLGTFGGRDSSAAAINDSDQITGYAVSSDAKAHAFFYSGGIMQDLGVFGGQESAGNSINSSGQVVGYYTYTPFSSTITHAFYYDGTRMFDLNYLIPANSGWTELTSAQGITDGRLITGYGTAPGGQTHAFLLKPDTNSSVTVTRLPDQLVGSGSTLVFTNFATDLLNPSNTFTFSLDPGFPPGATIDSNTGVVTWTAPTTDGNTTNIVTVRATVVGSPSQSGAATINMVVVGRPRLAARSPNLDGTISTIWTTYPSYTYTLQYKYNLSDPNWTFLTSAVATDTTTTFVDYPGSDTQRFYEVVSSIGTSDPAGFISFSCLGNSDTFVSMPFTRSLSASAVVDSVLNNVITIQLAQGWTNNQFVYTAGYQTNSYYLRFDSGAAEGRTYLITSNTANTIALNLGGDSLSAVAHNDRISIISYWTIGSIFPNGVGVNTSPTAGNRYTEVLIPDVTSRGINLSAAKVYYFQTNTWKQLGQTTDHGNDVVPPKSYLIIRHNVATSTTLPTVGVVALVKQSLTLNTSTTTPQDNAVSLVRPVAQSLDDSGLISSGGFASSPLPGQHTDELLTFDNTVAQRNKSSAAIYYYWSGAWRRVGAGATIVGGDLVFSPGAGIIIRKGTNSVPSVWVNSPNY